ncbi:hypothetical protein Tco_0084974 [Tanacetum coccineum]
MVPKFKWDKRRCHNQDLVLEAFDKRQIEEDFIISLMNNVYKLVPRDPMRNPGNGNIPDLIITVTHYLSNLIVTKLDGTKKFIDEIGELRAVSGHMLGASGVQIPQNILEKLQSIREEDGSLETVDFPV